MPLIATHAVSDSYRVFIWRLVGDDLHLRQELQDHGVDLYPIHGWHPKRQQEWITGRYLIHTLIPHHISQLIVSPAGKPYFANSEINFSISHSHDMIVIATSTISVGVDIQRTSTSVAKVSHKFITKANLQVFDSEVSLSDRQHILWSTKEAVFKAYGLGAVDFRQDITVHSARILNGSIVLEGKLQNMHIASRFTATATKLGLYYMVIAHLH